MLNVEQKKQQQIEKLSKDISAVVLNPITPSLITDLMFDAIGFAAQSLDYTEPQVIDMILSQFLEHGDFDEVPDIVKSDGVTVMG
jgi:hypothetical protein